MVFKIKQRRTKVNNNKIGKIIRKKRPASIKTEYKGIGRYSVSTKKKWKMSILGHIIRSLENIISREIIEKYGTVREKLDGLQKLRINRLKIRMKF